MPKQATISESNGIVERFNSSYKPSAMTTKLWPAETIITRIVHHYNKERPKCRLCPHDARDVASPAAG